tara:strand:+ start:764 stop:1285 length:522 start_codon:yes stop_codon:yes gene_type:complete
MAYAMGDRPPAPDPECFASDKLRVEIGGEKFAFPRNKITTIEGENIPNTTPGSATGKTMCQKPTDGSLELTSFMVEITPDGCDPKKKSYAACGGKIIQIILQDMDSLDIADADSEVKRRNSTGNKGRYHFQYGNIMTMVQFRIANYGLTSDDEIKLNEEILSPVKSYLNKAKQ